MKKIIYIEDFLSEDLYKKVLSHKNAQEFTIHFSGRSQSTPELSETNPELLSELYLHIKNTLDVKIKNASVLFFKRNTKVYNPHTDDGVCNLLIYLDGSPHTINNGTFFLHEKSKEHSLRVANIENSALFFPADYLHGPAQALHDDTGFRYSLNFFIWELEN